jgi:hypothetical protein
MVGAWLVGMLICAGRGGRLLLQLAFEFESVFDSPVPAFDDPGGFARYFVTFDGASPGDDLYSGRVHGLSQHKITCGVTTRLWGFGFIRNIDNSNNSASRRKDQSGGLCSRSLSGIGNRSEE